MFKKMLVATDREDGLDRLAQCLDSLHAGGLEQVTFVHSLDWEEDGIGIPDDMTDDIEATRSALLKACGDIPVGLTVDVLVQVGKPSEVIKSAIQQYQPDILVQGMAIRNLLVEKLFGSTTMELLPKVPIPVLIMRPQLVASLTLDELQLRCRQLFRSILLPCDFSETSRQLVSSIVHKMQDNSSHQIHSVLMIYVVDPGSRRNQGRSLEDLKSYYSAQLHELQQAFQDTAPDVQFLSEVRVGSPVKEILLSAGDTDMTAIATASRHTGNFWEWSIGSTTGEILRKSWHTILFFPFHRAEDA